jgi:hypothetical protein
LFSLIAAKVNVFVFKRLESDFDFITGLIG